MFLMKQLINSTHVRDVTLFTFIGARSYPPPSIRESGSCLNICHQGKSDMVDLKFESSQRIKSRIGLKVFTLKAHMVKSY